MDAKFGLLRKKYRFGVFDKKDIEENIWAPTEMT
jgi:hypothetical protein